MSLTKQFQTGVLPEEFKQDVIQTFGFEKHQNNIVSKTFFHLDLSSLQSEERCQKLFDLNDAYLYNTVSLDFDEINQSCSFRARWPRIMRHV